MDASLRLIDERKDDAMVLFWFSVLDSGERIFLPDSFYFCPPFALQLPVSLERQYPNSKLLDTYVGIVDSTEGISDKKIFLARLSRAADR